MKIVKFILVDEIGGYKATLSDIINNAMPGLGTDNLIIRICESIDTYSVELPDVVRRDAMNRAVSRWYNRRGSCAAELLDDVDNIPSWSPDTRAKEEENHATNLE